MPLQVYRLRRVLAATAVLLTMVVTGMYFYARMRARDVLKDVPNKLGFEIRQTANGFQISKSDGKRTLFTVQASQVKQFKLNGNAELHNVNIVVYGRDSSRFDQIYGDDFSFDQKTGDVTAKGEVQIELVANPSGTASPDQSTPKEVKNPIHLKTRDLVFNKDSGNAATEARVDFSTPQATGWAVGVRYTGKSNTLTLLSQIHIVMNGADASIIEAEHGIVTNDPRVVVLDHPHLDRKDETMQADEATFYLGRDNSVQRIVATDHVSAETRAASGRTPSGRAASEKTAAGSEAPAPVRSRADQAEFLFTEKQNLLRTGILTGNVHVEQAGPQPLEGDAGRIILDFASDIAGHSELEKVHALDGAHLIQRGVKNAGTQVATSGSTGMGSGPQNFELTAAAIDFTMAAGNILERAVTSGAAQITISPASESSMAGSITLDSRSNESDAALTASPQKTVVTAGKFDAQFATVDGKNRFSNIHGAPNARIVNSNPGDPDRVSTSESVDAIFLPPGGIDSITQQGNVVYTDNQAPGKRTQAWADVAHYTPADQMLVLTGNPRVSNGGMQTTAKAIHINRATGDALAEGDVKSTYSDLKEQPNGALLASSSPIHVTARTMTVNSMSVHSMTAHSMSAHNTPGTALYTGNARLWQDANIIEAPSIEFDRDRRFVTAQGTAAQPAQTTLVQKETVQKKAEGNETVGNETDKGERSEGKRSAATASQPRHAKTAKKGGRDAAKPTPLGSSSPIIITALKLTYADSERKVHYENGVLAKGEDFTAKAQTADAYLRPRNQAAGSQSLTGPSQLDYMVASDDVVITQPNRHADGQKLVYTAADDKFVLTGGASKLPSIFDAEQGKITGVSLTFFRTDDRVLVEGEASTPVVTQTRVAR